MGWVPHTMPLLTVLNVIADPSRASKRTRQTVELRWTGQNLGVFRSIVRTNLWFSVLEKQSFTRRRASLNSKDKRERPRPHSPRSCQTGIRQLQIRRWRWKMLTRCHLGVGLDSRGPCGCGAVHLTATVYVMERVAEAAEGKVTRVWRANAAYSVSCLIAMRHRHRHRPTVTLASRRVVFCALTTCWRRHHGRLATDISPQT